MGLEDQTKKALAQMVRDLEAKLKEMKPLEKAQTANIEDLKSCAVGLIKDDLGYYSMVKIKFDATMKKAAIESVEKIDTRDVAIVHYKLNQYTAEEIVRKTRGGKYNE